jgi:hypothetical protein
LEQRHEFSNVDWDVIEVAFGWTISSWWASASHARLHWHGAAKVPRGTGMRARKSRMYLQKSCPLPMEHRMNPQLPLSLDTPVNNGYSLNWA